jgi:hypothetical protein
VATISLEQDAKYRADGSRYVELCAACGKDRTGDACTCGATFERLKRRLLARRVGLASAFGKGVGAYVGLALSVAACVAAWRAYGWIRFASFDHRSFRFRARRRGYATLLANLNKGRVL